MFGNVVDMLPWSKRKTPTVSTNASETSETVEAIPAAIAYTRKEDAPVLGQITVSEFEQILTRVEVAKKTVEVREHHAGGNRNRARRRIRAIGIAVFGAFLIS
ncbi:MAG: hypothetical protein AAB869_03545, partial [Patescibacteria group bacterium]